MAPDDAYKTGGGGRLKLKGSKVDTGRIEKKKKKKAKTAKAKTSEETSAAEGDASPAAGEGIDTDAEGRVKKRDVGEEEKGKEKGDGEGEGEGEGEIVVGKTEAEKRYEEQRKKRLHDRLKREGVKTHKERVEELNKYLSSLTEHHDMPKIGPG